MAFTRLQDRHANGASVDITFNNNNTAGTLLVAVWRTPSGTPTGVSDSTNGAWQYKYQDEAGDGNQLSVAYFINNAVSGAKVTVDLDGTGLSADSHVTIAEYSYTATLTEQDWESQDNGSSTTAPSGGAITVPAGDMIAIGASARGGTSAVTPNGSFDDVSSDNSCRANLCEILDAASGALEYNPSFASSQYNAAGLLILGEATGGGSIIPTNPLLGPLAGPIGR